MEGNLSQILKVLNKKNTEMNALFRIMTNTQLLPISVQICNNFNNVLNRRIIFETLWEPMNSAQEIFVDGDFKLRSS